MPSDDGAAFYAEKGIATALYDRLFAAPSIDGDLAFYEALARRTGPRIVDAACGTGRVACHLARPDRRLFAFDASPYFVAGLRRRLTATPAAGPVAVRLARLESYAGQAPCDAVIVAYYGFAHVLAAADRAAGLARLLGLLRPGGRLVVHLPRADLLTRPVPAHELAALGFEEEIPADALLPAAHGRLRLRQDVEAMDYDAAKGVRTIALRYRLLSGERVLRDERSALRYAAVPAAELQDVAGRHGARIACVLSGFRQGVDSECVVEIEKP